MQRIKPVSTVTWGASPFASTLHLNTRAATAGAVRGVSAGEEGALRHRVGAVEVPAAGGGGAAHVAAGPRRAAHVGRGVAVAPRPPAGCATPSCCTAVKHAQLPAGCSHDPWRIWSWSAGFLRPGIHAKLRVVYGLTAFVVACSRA